jgi:predicted dehydrogenase
MDWHEAFQVYGEYGSVVGKTLNPWYPSSSEVECFSVRDGQYHRVLGADAHVYRLQLDGFTDTILHGAPMHDASIEDGVQALRTLVAISPSVASGALIVVAEVTGGV